MIIGSNVVILTLLTHLTFTNEANCAGGVTGSCCCLALRLLSFVFDANCLPPGTRRGRGHSAWMTWNYCLESKEAWDHRQVREARGLGEGRMKLQSLEALPPPCPQGSGQLQAYEASCPGRRPRGGGEVPMPLSPGPNCQLETGAPQGPGVEGAPVSSWQLETGPARLALLSLAPWSAQ